jgi:hypothetical protein
MSLVQSFSLEVAVKSNSDPNQASPNSALSGMDVFLLRAWKSRPAGVPQNEGMHLNTYASDNNGKGYEIISKEVTNGSGKVLLKRLIRHSGIASDVYYLAVQSNPNSGTNNTYGNLDKSDKSNFPSDYVGIIISQDNEKTNNAFGAYTFNSEYNHFQNSTTRLMSPAKPRLSYRVVRKDKSTDGVASASASMVFKKLFSKETISTYSDKDGYVVFNNLQTGLESTLTISHPSYNYENQDEYTESIPALKNGVQLVQKEIPLHLRDWLQAQSSMSKIKVLERMSKLGKVLMLKPPPILVSILPMLFLRCFHWSMLFPRIYLILRKMLG